MLASTSPVIVSGGLACVSQGGSMLFQVEDFRFDNDAY